MNQKDEELALCATQIEVEFCPQRARLLRLILSYDLKEEEDAKTFVGILSLDEVEILTEQIVSPRSEPGMVLIKKQWEIAGRTHQRLSAEN